MKKKYIKPSMSVYELQHTAPLLQSSGEQWLNYTPGLNADDQNHLA